MDRRSLRESVYEIVDVTPLLNSNYRAETNGYALHVDAAISRSRQQVANSSSDKAVLNQKNP